MFYCWVEILPLFLVSILAKKYCERFTYYYEERVKREFAQARPDIFVKVAPKQDSVL